MRSVIGNKIASTSITDFYTNSTDILRDTVLGDLAGSSGEREGRIFNENNMKIYELEIVNVTIIDSQVRTLIESTNRDVLIGSAEKVKFDAEKQIYAIKTERDNLTSEFNRSVLESQKLVNLTEEDNAKVIQLARISREKELLDHSLNKKSLELESQKIIDAHKQKLLDHELELEVKRLTAEANAFKSKGEAISPELSAAIQQLVQGNLLRNLGELAPLAIVQGTSLAGVLSKLLEGTQFEDLLSKLNSNSYNRIAAE
jgi:major vault protein